MSADGVAPELTAELIVDSAAPLSPQLSPDGRWVAFGVTTIGRKDEHPASAVWVVPADGSTPPRKLTAGTAKDAAPRWSPDSAWIYFLSDREERGTAQLYRIRLDGGEAEALTTWKAGIAGHLPLAEHGTVAVVARDEPTDEDERREKDRDDPKVWGERVPYARLRLLDLDTRALRTVDGLGDRHVVEVRQRPDGGPLAVCTWVIPDIDPGILEPRLHLVDPDGERVRDLGPAGVEASSLTWWNAADGWHLAYLALTPPALVGGFAVLDLAVPESGPAAEHLNLTARMTVCPADLTQVADGPPLALFSDGLDTAIYRLDTGESRFVEVSRVDGLVESLTADRSGEVVAAIVSTSYEPKNVHAGSPGAPLRRISDTRKELRGIRWGIQERLSYKASDGLSLDGLLILPAGKSREDGPFPLVTLVHGGPYARHADQFMLGWFPSGQWLATAGYAVFLPNPRGGEGHGHDFAAAVAGAALPIPIGWASAVGVRAVS